MNMIRTHKIWTTVVIVLIILIAAGYYFDHQFHRATQFTWGIDFSQQEARNLGFDARTMYLDILTDLKPQKMRLSAYWNDIEPAPGQYNFKEMDDYLTLAAQYHVQIILELGKKQPRWPECFQPDWVKKLPSDQQTLAERDMLRAAINHFKSFSAITTWQIENEPGFDFGADCPTIPLAQLKAETSLVKSLDSRPVLVTDSGELGRWLPVASAGADEFGSTMYRVVHSPTLGYFKYPLPPLYFRIKAGILNVFQHPKQIIGVELQAEPWVVDGVLNTDLSTQQTLMNPKIFATNVSYAERVGFADNYLWGVEWWYWMAKKNNDWGMWGAVKQLLAK